MSCAVQQADNRRPMIWPFKGLIGTHEWRNKHAPGGGDTIRVSEAIGSVPTRPRHRENDVTISLHSLSIIYSIIYIMGRKA